MELARPARPRSGIVGRHGQRPVARQDASSLPKGDAVSGARAGRRGRGVPVPPDVRDLGPSDRAGKVEAVRAPGALAGGSSIGARAIVPQATAREPQRQDRALASPGLRSVGNACRRSRNMHWSGGRRPGFMTRLQPLTSPAVDLLSQPAREALSADQPQALHRVRPVRGQCTFRDARHGRERHGTRRPLGQPRVRGHRPDGQGRAASHPGWVPRPALRGEDHPAGARLTARPSPLTRTTHPDAPG